MVEQLAERFPQAAELLDEGKGDLLAFRQLPKEVWRQPWSTNPLDRLNKDESPNPNPSNENDHPINSYTT